jgi:hypothetical protein
MQMDDRKQFLTTYFNTVGTILKIPYCWSNSKNTILSEQLQNPIKKS